MNVPSPYDLTGEFYKNLRKKNCQIYAKASEKLKRKEYIPTYPMISGQELYFFFVDLKCILGSLSIL